MASDWLATVLPANQLRAFKIFVNQLINMEFNMEIS